MCQNLWTLPCVIALRYWSGSMTDAWGTYALVTVLLSYPYCHAICVAWASRNSNNVGTRTVSAAMYNMMVQVSQAICSPKTIKHANMIDRLETSSPTKCTVPTTSLCTTAVIGICSSSTACQSVSS